MRRSAYVLLALLLPCAVGQAQTRQTLQRGSAVQAVLAANDTARYTIQLADSAFVLGVLEQLDVPLVIRLLNPQGQQRARFQGPGAGAMRFATFAPMPGTFTVEVIAADGKPGRYALTIERVEPLAKDPRRRADQMLARYDASDSPGAVFRVWRNGRVLYTKPVGMANLAYGIPYRADTRTNIGSTSKQFTAFAVLLEAERGALSLDDDIRKHVPELPFLGDTVRVRHLITHTSGLREFLNLLIMGGRRLDHGDWIDRTELIAVVQRQPALQNVPGAEFNYNNTAFGLAALIVERTSGQDFPRYMRERVFQPLGMTRTMVRASPEHIVPGMSEGYTPGADGYREIGDLGGAMGAGGIYSTVEDLQRWAEHMDAARPVVGSRAILDQMMTPSLLNDGKESGYGMGVFVDTHRGLRRIQHGGADVAHRSMLAVYPDIDAGVTIQSNHAGFNSGLAFTLAEIFFADAMTPDSMTVAATPTAFNPSTMTPARFDAFAGRFALDAAPTFVLRFFREGSTFYTQATGQQRLEIEATSDTSFAIKTVPATIAFHRGEGGRVTGLTLFQNGAQQRATRLADTDAAAAGFNPKGVALEAFAGRYFSEELEAFYTLVVSGDSLMLQQRRHEDVRLTPGNTADAFSGRDLSFAFERDRNGVIVGFYVSNGRTRDVRFARQRP